MDSNGVNKGRRRLLATATAVVGGAGAIALAVPFIKAWNPSARALAAGAPVEADIGAIEPGQKVLFEWRGKPVWVVRRTQAMLDTLDAVANRLADPDSENIDQQPVYAANAYRSLKPEYLVLVGICTHLSCSPKFEPAIEPKPYDADWLGGFFCPCHGSKFDLAGRVYKGVPAPSNLPVPPHYYIDDTRILIGEDPGEEEIA